MSEATPPSSEVSPATHLDAAAPIREGERLDDATLAKLEAWLRERAPLRNTSGDLEVLQFRAGYSNLTYLLRLGERELVLRRPPYGAKIKSGHDMSREYNVLSKLAPAWPKAPAPLAYCEDAELLGAPFYVMERLQGIILRRSLPKGLAYDEAGARALSESLIDGLAELHGLDYAAAGLAELGRPEGYVSRQVEGWTARYHKAKTDEHAPLEAAMEWLARSMPAEAGATLIHNDYKYDNVVLDPGEPTRIIGVLDWEMCTLGDPLMDLGTTLGYWVEAGDDPRARMMAFGPTQIPGSLTRAELVARYAEKTGREIEDPVFYYVFGLFKIAVIIQQIYARYKKGLTKDPRFAPLGHFVGLLGEVAAARIDDGKL